LGARFRAQLAGKFVRVGCEEDGDMTVQRGDGVVPDIERRRALALCTTPTPKKLLADALQFGLSEDSISEV